MTKTFKYGLVLAAALLASPAMASKFGLGKDASEEFTDKRVAQLVQALDKKDYEAADAARNAGADINEMGETGLTPLAWVMQNGADLKAVRYLLRAGANPNVRTEDHQAPVYIAAADNRTDLLQALLEHGANPNVSGKKGDTALIQAVRHKNDEAVDALLEHGVDVNKRTRDDETAATIAADMGRFDMISSMIDHGLGSDLTDLAKHVQASKPWDPEQKRAQARVLKELQQRGAKVATASSREDD